jgi:hypothetical protein
MHYRACLWRTLSYIFGGRAAGGFPVFFNGASQEGLTVDRFARKVWLSGTLALEGSSKAQAGSVFQGLPLSCPCLFLPR